MKKIIVLPVLLFLSTVIFSQVESAQIAGEFKQVLSNGGSNGIQTYSTGEVKGSQFFFPNWTTGSVTTKSNQVISKNYLFLYDKVRQQLFIKQADSSVILTGEKDQISGFTLNGDQVYNFVSASIYDPSDQTNFYEVLSSDSKGYSLLKLVKANFVKADQTDMLRMKDGDIYDKFVDDISYYISYDNGIPKKITFKEKSIAKAFPAVKEKLTAYFDQHDGQSGNENFLINVVKSFND
ncbi:MAG: hypothetical protein ABI358_08795 [Ginsengibacter sp.]